jgi:hypothetical protein
MRQIFALAAALVACIGADAPVPAWLVAKPGAVVFTSTGEEDSPTTPVCPTVASYREYVDENGAKGCVERPAGVKVVIDAIVPATAALAAMAKVHAQSGAFHGYTALTELLPPIPKGVAITLAPAANETLTISGEQRAELGAGLDLGARVSAVTLRFDPANDQRDLLVRVTSGKFAGKSGWLFARQAFIGDLPINVLK